MTGGDDYEVRPYDPADRGAVLDLYETTFGHRSPEWFEWRYVENPYLPGTPIHVATCDGRVVGARPSLPIPLSAGDETVTALMQVDPMVHPDHRRRGLFSRMAVRVHDHYAGREPSVTIGFPNEAALAGLTDLASELGITAGAQFGFPEYFRVQDPGAIARDRDGGDAARLFARLATPVARGYLAARDVLTPDGDDHHVRRLDGVPAGTLADLAAEGPTTRAHACRDERFYRWRFANPRYDYRTYLATERGTPRAAVVVGVRGADDGTARTANVSEVLPMRPDARTDEVSAVLAAAVADLDGVAAVATGGGSLARPTLAAHGFLSEDSLPLSLVSSKNHVLARPLVEGRVDDWVVGGTRLTDPDSWRLSYFERALG